MALAFLFGVASVVDAHLFVRVVQLPVLVLVLLVEIHHEQRVLEVDKEVPHVGILLWLFLISDDVKVAVSVFVRAVDLLFQLFLVVAARDVLHAKVRARVFTLLYKFHLDGLSLASIRFGCRACILGA